VAKRYDLRVVFRAVSGEARPGEVLVITGPNGSGKSTLLSILCGLLRPTRGVVRYRRQDGDDLPRDEWGRHLGVVAPSMAVYEELTALAGQDWLKGHVQTLVDEGRTVVLATNDRREMTWGSRNVSLAG